MNKIENLIELRMVIKKDLESNKYNYKLHEQKLIIVDEDQDKYEVKNPELHILYYVYKTNYEIDEINLHIPFYLKYESNYKISCCIVTTEQRKHYATRLLALEIGLAIQNTLVDVKEMQNILFGQKNLLTGYSGEEVD